MAGLTHESAFYVGVDNHGPQISAPASWSVDDTVTLAVTDAGSGVDEVVVKILDPLNRYPTRVLQYEGGAFPLAFTWDRHFEDGTLAPHGEYTVLITAADNFGNESVLNARVGVPLIGHIFGGYNTATPMPTLLPTLTPTPRGTAPTLAPTSTLAATELAFGVPVTGTGAGGTSSSAPASPAPHSSPPSLGFTSFIQDVFFPASGSTVVETTTTSPAAQPLSAASAGVLFGSAAVSATTGLAAYYLQKKKEEEEARREAILAKIAAEKKAAEKQREAIFERNSQQAAANLKAKLKEMELLGVSDDTIKEVKRRYTEIGYKSAESLANAAIKIETTVIPYTREKVDPVLENYTGKPSISMSDAVKITNPQTHTEPNKEKNGWEQFWDGVKQTATNAGKAITKFVSDNVDTSNEGDRNHPKEVFTYSPGGYSMLTPKPDTTLAEEDGCDEGVGATQPINRKGLDIHATVDSGYDFLVAGTETGVKAITYANERDSATAKLVDIDRRMEELAIDATKVDINDPRVPIISPENYVLEANTLLDEKNAIKFPGKIDLQDQKIDLGTGVIGGVSIAMQLGGDYYAEKDPRLSRNLSGTGDLIGAGLDCYEGIQFARKPAEIALEFAKSPIGKTNLVVLAAGGGLDFAINSTRLVSDPSIDLNKEGNDVLNERTGVAMQAAGGAAVLIGAVAAIFALSAGAAIVPVALTALVVGGVACTICGVVVEDWDWISGK